MNDQSLKEKGITINGKGGTPEKLGSLYGNGAALQGISERLEKQTQKIKEQMDQNKEYSQI